MNQNLKLLIVSPEKTLYDGQIHHITLPGELGSFTVFKGHAPLISALKSGDIKYTDDKQSKETLTINSGFVEINNDTVSVCVEQ